MKKIVKQEFLRSWQQGDYTVSEFRNYWNDGTVTIDLNRILRMNYFDSSFKTFLPILDLESKFENSIKPITFDELSGYPNIQKYLSDLLDKKDKEDWVYF